MPYRAPVSELRFVLDKVAGFDRVAATEAFAEATPETVDAILTEAGRMCDDVLAPLNRKGDQHPAHLENGVVRTSPGFADGFRAIAEGGWIGMSADPAHGGMGLPIALTMAVNEMIGSACLALQLNPLMTQGQIEALEAHASDEIKETYIPKLVSGEWCGTMNLTEPQAGSDVGALRTKAEPNGDGTYAVTGQKIYISWGDNDFAENICHLVLARLPDAAEGTRGISLFMVPKRLPDADGNAGQANSLRVVSLEHKLGLHGSPTAVMEYDGATGWLVGEPHKGMAAMFTMMNNARLGVGVQGLSVAEAALQHAIGYALDRKQGKTRVPDGSILEHADVRRMILGMKAETFAVRALAMECAVALDMAKATGDVAWRARGAFLTPIAKAFGTDTGIKVAGDGIQVHGGMGFVEETGAAQFLRDVRVTAIYEGTNGIQAMDLVGRKLMDGGAAAFALLDEMGATEDAALRAAVDELRDLTEWMVAQDMQDRFAGAVSYLAAFARVLGTHHHLKAAAADPARAHLARFARGRFLPEARAEMAKARSGADELFALSADEIAA
ncbi:Acyl-CoA dehydrogenase [Jannaschia seosinensis]|uniref:3-methylmercaptopropionyl-CoA dehydrogenase n=1 Tax=Jannaschia seosinensis TaxID=313367 RepID=A0A0M7BEX9_9RHOB|nr:acyl-CoA dehydrogenase [Jannaschia seosinensis]CUH40342.1 Acyl-CoA dehydrogenase [Jannaschia seosinensis]